MQKILELSKGNASQSSLHLLFFSHVVSHNFQKYIPNIFFHSSELVKGIRLPMSKKLHFFGELHGKELYYNFNTPNDTTKIFKGLKNRVQHSATLSITHTLGMTTKVLVYFVFLASITVRTERTHLPSSLEEPVSVLSQQMEPKYTNRTHRKKEFSQQEK